MYIDNGSSETDHTSIQLQLHSSTVKISSNQKNTDFL